MSATVYHINFYSAKKKPTNAASDVAEVVAMPLNRVATSHTAETLMEALNTGWPQSAHRGPKGELIVDAVSLSKLRNMFDHAGLEDPLKLGFDESLRCWSVLYAPVSLNVRARLNQGAVVAANSDVALLSGGPDAVAPQLKEQGSSYVEALVQGNRPLAKKLAHEAVDSLLSWPR